MKWISTIYDIMLLENCTSILNALLNYTIKSKHIPSIQTFHSNISFSLFSRAFVCTLCPSSFKNSALLYKHQDVHKSEPKKFVCDVCHRSFRRKFDLNNHMLCHTQLRKYNCDHCSRTFLTRRGLRNHVGLHTNERQFMCGICPMSFLYSSSAAIHRRIHKVNNAFKCDSCSIEIKNFRNFRMHLEVCRKDEVKVLKQ